MYPIFLFIFLFAGSGLFFSYQGTELPFYQISPTVAILPAILLGWVMKRGATEEKVAAFLEGVRHRDIITMCLVFLLSGAFTSVSASIGSVAASVNLALYYIPSEYLLVGIFLTAAFISTAIGTSMGTIATLGPITAGLIHQGAFPAEIGMATVVGGAIFGDNLSLISDTTIASVMSQEASMDLKLRLNCKVAMMAALITVALLLFLYPAGGIIEAQAFSFWLVSPYVLLVVMAFFRFNVFVVLFSSLGFAALLGFCFSGYTPLTLSQDIVKGFHSMHEIMLLSLLVGGLSALSGGTSRKMDDQLFKWMERHHGSPKLAQLLIAKMVALFDLLLANNTVAIVFSGKTAKLLAERYGVPPHYSAAWLDIFSCACQGVIPYGAQILLAASMAGISPLSITTHVYYCYILALVAICYIVLYDVKYEEVPLPHVPEVG